MNYFMLALATLSFGGSIPYFIQGKLTMGTMVMAWVVADVCVMVLAR